MIATATATTAMTTLQLTESGATPLPHLCTTLEITRLAMTTTGGTRIHFNKVIRLDPGDNLVNTSRSRMVDSDSFGVERLDGATAHAAADHAVYHAVLQLVHRVAGTVRVVRIAIRQHRHLIGVAVVKREEGGRAEVIMHLIFATGIAPTGNTG